MLQIEFMSNSKCQGGIHFDLELADCANSNEYCTTSGQFKSLLLSFPLMFECLPALQMK